MEPEKLQQSDSVYNLPVKYYSTDDVGVTIAWFCLKNRPSPTGEGKGMRPHSPAVFFSHCFDSILVMR